jgi:hypothetical protein
MNLGTQTNSLVNHLYSRMTVGAPKPVVGMAATTLAWTDRHAATVVSVTELDGKRWSHQIEVTEDLVEVVSGSTHDGSAKFATRPDPEGSRDLYRMDRKTGAWVRGYINATTGKFNKFSGGLILGQRDHHVDPSF